MDNFIANIKNKLMLPGSEDKEEKIKRNPPIIPMLDVDNMTATEHRVEAPAQGISQIKNEQDKPPEQNSSKSSFKVLLKSLTSKEKQDEEPKHIPNPIEDDIFIYYD